jgi:hypothetical protein
MVDLGKDPCLDLNVPCAIIFSYFHPLFLCDPMANLFKSIKRLYSSPRQDTREHSRYSCFIPVHYLVKGSWYRGSIRSISEGGAYIRSIQKGGFHKSDPISMVVEFGHLRHQIRGKIIRLGSEEIAVEFDTSEPEYSELKTLLTDYCFF